LRTAREVARERKSHGVNIYFWLTPLFATLRHSSPLFASLRFASILAPQNFFKTSSLIANSAMCTAILGGAEGGVVRESYEYGKYLGNAFQLVDDVLDFEGNVEILGKERYGDLKSGLATGPVLFAEERKPEMRDLRLRKFSETGDIQRALDIIYSTDALERTKDLARVNAEMAADVVSGWDGERESMIELCKIVVEREK